MINKPLWQTEDWDNFQKAIGLKTILLGKEKESQLMVITPFLFGMNYGAIPRGPIVSDIQGLEKLLEEIEKVAADQQLIFTRLSPEQELSIPHRLKRSKTPYSSLPDSTLVLDLEQSEEKLLQQMKRKGRYNISLAKKKGVLVKRAQTEQQKKEYVQIFTDLLQETTQRDQFSGHDLKYYQTMLTVLKSSEIMVAFFEEQPLAAGIFCFLPDSAIYYYGASGNSHRELMAPYLLQWEAIREAKKQGCKSYDFLGIAPEEAPADHPWKGITAFKCKFGGSVIKYPPNIDIIHRPWWYRLYRFLKLLQKILKKR